MAIELKPGDEVRLAWQKHADRPVGTVMQTHDKTNGDQWVTVRFGSHDRDVTYTAKELEVRDKNTGEYKPVATYPWP